MHIDFILTNKTGQQRKLSDKEFECLRLPILSSSNFINIVTKSFFKQKFKNFYYLSKGLFYKINEDFSKKLLIRDKIFKNLFGFDYDVLTLVFTDKNQSKTQIKLHFSHVSDLSEFINQIILKNQYNLSNNLNNKIIIDIGAHVGVFSIFAAMKNPKKIYAFEPVKETYEILCDNIKLNNFQNKVIPINKGVGNENIKKDIQYRVAADGGASFEIGITGIGKIKKQKCQLTTLDSFAKEKNIKIDFIKVDAEGSEKKILLGAKNIIKKYKPIISMSAYHKPEDMTELPKTVLSIRNDYKYILFEKLDKDFYFY